MESGISSAERRRFSGVVLVVLLLDIATKIAAELCVYTNDRLTYEELEPG